MIAALILRLQAGTGEDAALDTHILRWAEGAVGFADDAEFLSHCYGLSGNLTGAARFAAWLMPSAVFAFEWVPGERRASVTADGGRALVARELANALIAAALDAYLQATTVMPKAANEASLATARRA